MRWWWKLCYLFRFFKHWNTYIIICFSKDPNPCEQYNGIYGWDGVCCAKTCSTCGGKGCANGGNKAKNCCNTRITLGGKVCGEDGQLAPCTVLELLEFWRHFYLAKTSTMKSMSYYYENTFSFILVLLSFTLSKILGKCSNVKLTIHTLHIFSSCKFWNISYFHPILYFFSRS